MSSRPLALYSPPKIVLPRISTNLAEQWDKLSKFDITGQVILGGLSWSYTQKATTQRGRSYGSVIGLTVDDQQISMCIDTDITKHIAFLADFTEPFEKLAPDRLAFVIEHALSEELTALEEATGLKIAITQVVLNVEFDTLNQLGAWSARQDAAADQELTVYLDAEERTSFVDKLTANSAQKSNRNLRHLKVPTVYMGPVAILGSQDISQVQEGAVFFPDQEWSYSRLLPRYLKVGRNLLHLVNKDGELVADGNKENLDALLERYGQGGISMKRGSENNGQTTALVTVELAREELSVSDIEDIKAGAVIDFEISHIEGVTLSVSGETIAEGRLVQLDDTVGVQITRLL